MSYILYLKINIHRIKLSYLLLATIVCVCSTYHLIVSLNFDHQSKNESALSASNNKKPLYSVPHAWVYSPTSSIPEGKLFFNSCIHHWLFVFLLYSLL